MKKPLRRANNLSIAHQVPELHDAGEQFASRDVTVKEIHGRDRPAANGTNPREEGKR